VYKIIYLFINTITRARVRHNNYYSILSYHDNNGAYNILMLTFILYM